MYLVLILAMASLMKLYESGKLTTRIECESWVSTRQDRQNHSIYDSTAIYICSVALIPAIFDLKSFLRESPSLLRSFPIESTTQACRSLFYTLDIADHYQLL
ncbi:hypothetical protein F5Y18DRAFT_373365 [Xylariaceae sp. FL1019]|nr:hypothetical protein F5Y18DRAFT_373365 [Xylariaceae sp. FL1019]